MIRTGLFHRTKSILERNIRLFIQAKEKELDLPAIVIPELDQLEKAHYDLLSEYVHVIGNSSRQPFFMSPIQKFHLLNKWNLIRRLISLIFWSANPLRLITLRPLVTFLIQTHIRSKLGELEVAYVQMKYAITNDAKNKYEIQTWLDQAKSDCSQLKETISSGKIIGDTIKTIFISLIGLLLAFFGVSNIYDLIVKFSSTNIIVQYFWMILAIFLLLLSLVIYGAVIIRNTFDAKRSIFLSIGKENDKRTIYSLENNLFDLLDRRKSPEFALDYLTMAINIIFASGFFIFLSYMIDEATNKSVGKININCGWASVILLALFFSRKSSSHG